MIKSREIISVILFVVFIITIQYKGLFSDFIIDEEEKKIEEKEIKKIEKEEEKLSKYISRNINAEVIPDIIGAIRITWELHKDADEDFIIGRSTTVPDTIEKALRSVSIKVVPSGAKTEVIDSNLKPGSYYYCVLAKSKIMERDIKLYAKKNYTINPAIIEKIAIREPEKTLPQQVSLIYTRIINNSQVRITWRGIETRSIIYTVYRGNSPLDTPAKLSQADRIKVITDGRESYIDTNITKTGTYYYAVSTKDISGNEDLNLIPDQSYTVSGIYISLEVPAPVKNISARPAGDGVKLSWVKTSSGVAEYLIYRYSGAISDSDRISLSNFLGRVPENETVYIDKNPGPGNYYYAVLTKFLNGKVLNDLVKSDNYTVEPVVIGSQIQIVSFEARSGKNQIELTWKTSGNLGNKSYKILRKNNAIKNNTDLQSSEIVAYVNLDDLKYIDKDLKPGKYYYAILPESVDYSKELALNTGINILEKSVLSAGESAKIKIPEEKLKPEPMQGEKRVVKKPAEKVIVSTVDEIIKKYFLTGYYNYAIKHFEDVVKNSNNVNDVAKAKLYLGRTFIELKKYKEAVQLLILKDVNDIYPKEARFWKEYALSRIENGGKYIFNDNF